jgi:hypothetical protein
MVAGGLLFLFFMLDPIVHGQGGKVSGWPLAIVRRAGTAIAAHHLYRW